MTEASAGQEFEFPPIEFKDERPVFSVLVIGTSGSGKTVFLSALEEQLSVLGTNGFRLKSETPEQTAFLKNHYDMVRNPSRQWPPPTPGSISYEFVALPPSNISRKNKPLFRFHYIDFPGGYVTAPRPEDDMSLHDAMEAAHTIVFLIDGIKLHCKQIRAIIPNLPTLDDELNVLSSYAQDCIDRVPIQFFITKWDIVKTSMTLATARDHLLSNARFRQVFGQLQERKSTAHIVPVSAVGDNFARFDIETNEMKKYPGAAAQPYHLDVSMALAINDAILKRGQIPLSKSAFIKRYCLKALASGRSPAKWILRFFMVTGDVWAVRMALLLEGLIDAVSKNSVEALSRIDERLKTAKDHSSALEAVVSKQRFIVADFLNRFPSSAVLDSPPSLIKR